VHGSQQRVDSNTTYMCNVRITLYNVKYTIIVPLFYFKKVMRVQLYTIVNISL